MSRTQTFNTLLIKTSLVRAVTHTPHHKLIHVTNSNIQYIIHTDLFSEGSALLGSCRHGAGADLVERKQLRHTHTQPQIAEEFLTTSALQSFHILDVAARTLLRNS